jgi:hypothetical protein
MVPLMTSEGFVLGANKPLKFDDLGYLGCTRLVSPPQIKKQIHKYASSTLGYDAGTSDPNLMKRSPLNASLFTDTAIQRMCGSKAALIAPRKTATTWIRMIQPYNGSSNEPFAWHSQ